MDVLTFIQSNCGNSGAAVYEKDVHKLHDRTDPASSNVIIL
ncbi:cytochrome c [Pantoea sp. S62]|nr:cytochrome c [Pantoea sp. S62]